MRKILLLALLSFAAGVTSAQELKTNISVHDPVMIKQDSIYYLFCTGQGISMWSSKDRVHWRTESNIFETAPQWVLKVVPGFKNHIWAPDISYYNGNAIDPNLITDRDGTPYLAFGSFWEGIKIVKLKKDRMVVDGDVNNLPAIASRIIDPSKGNPPAVDGNPPDAGGNAIEAPFIFRKGRYFYLFASIDYCCKGPKSTYKMIIGRSKKLLGPYLDKAGVPMNKGGGSILLAGDKNWYGVGHNAVCDFNGTDYLIFHGYDANDKAIPKLRIEKLEWVQGWPEVMINTSQN